MRSGAPAFGTPEYVKASFGAGQLARRLGIPWRSSNANASNVADAQAAYESEMAVWGAIMGGVSLLYQGAGWLEGGLTASYEKLIVDAEILQMMSEVVQPLVVDDASLGLDAIADVGPGGHFFGTAHTLERYETAFYRPLLSDCAPSRRGRRTASGPRPSARTRSGSNSCPMRSRRRSTRRSWRPWTRPLRAASVGSRPVGDGRRRETTMPN
jgi:trimethylamine:corrinoid methyltransferase-like protein